VASLFYATFTVYSRRMLRHEEPVTIAAGAITTCALIAGVLVLVSPALGGPASAPLSALRPDVLASVLVLGFANTFLAYLIFYELIPKIGAARTSMVTYVVPPVGLLLGAIFLNEQIDARLLVGAALIFAGIAVVNIRLRRQGQPQIEVIRQAD
jgi:drug/metabolite transporter (DMT)-like permease